eukprot:40193-Pelagomonas_calceolata.AAC.3
MLLVLLLPCCAVFRFATIPNLPPAEAGTSSHETKGSKPEQPQSATPQTPPPAAPPPPAPSNTQRKGLGGLLFSLMGKLPHYVFMAMELSDQDVMIMHEQVRSHAVIYSPVACEHDFWERGLHDERSGTGAKYCSAYAWLPAGGQHGSLKSALFAHGLSSSSELLLSGAYTLSGPSGPAGKADEESRPEP